MKILFRRRFKKLREEFADLGDTKLDIIESAAEKYSSSYDDYKDFMDSDNRYSLERNLDNVKITRSAEYFIRYYKLLKARSNATGAIVIGASTAGFIWLLKKTFEVAKNNSTLEDEYRRGQKDKENEIEKYCLDRGGKDSWIGDVADGRHMILRITDEETDDYKDFFALLEQEAEEKAAEEATVIY